MSDQPARRLPDRLLGRLDLVDPVARRLRVLSSGERPRFHHARLESWIGEGPPVAGQTVLFALSARGEAVAVGPGDAEKLGLSEPGRARGVVDAWSASLGVGRLRVRTRSRGVEVYPFSQRDWQGPPSPAVGAVATFRVQGAGATDVRPE